MGSEPPIARLSTELLSAVFDQVLQGTGSTSSLLDCMLCCRGWLPLAHRALYRDVVLNAQTLRKFVAREAPVITVVVHTLTVRLDPTELDQPTAVQLLEHLAVRHLKGMTQLGSLSIYQIPRLKVKNDFAIPTNGLAPVLENLPPSCTALEIDSVKMRRRSWDEEDYRRDGPEDKVHLCPYLRKVLPRLQYLRLRLNSLCPDLCGTGYRYDPSKPAGEVEDDYTAVDAPHLRECIISVARKWGPDHGHYGEPNSVLCHDPARLQPCLPALAAHMQRLVRRESKKEGSSSGPEKLWIVDYQPNLGHPRDLNYYAAFVRRDIPSQNSMALPHRHIGALEPDNWHLRYPVPAATFEGRNDDDRAPEWEDVVGYVWAIEQVAEGPAWEDSDWPLPGLRLPSARLRSTSSLAPAKLPMRPKDEFFATRKRNCVLWANERITGQKLLEPTRKALLAQHRDLDMRIPEGWHFPMEGSSFLEKIP